MDGAQAALEARVASGDDAEAALNAKLEAFKKTVKGATPTYQQIKDYFEPQEISALWMRLQRERQWGVEAEGGLGKTKRWWRRHCGPQARHLRFICERQRFLD